MVVRNYSIFGIPVSNLDLSESINSIIEKSEGEKHAPKYIATVNSDFIANIYGWGFQNIQDPELLKIIKSSALITPDGMPLVWLSRILGNGLKERVAGADLVPLLARELAKNNRSIFLLGGDPDVAKQAAEKLTTINPSLKIVGIATPKISLNDDHKSLIHEINQAAPDVLLINLGNPKQELWFKSIRNELKVPVSIGIGGALNFVTGKTKRAPLWMQKSGFEWLYRLIQEPKRLFRRYFIDIIKFFWFSIPLVIFHTLNHLFTLPKDLTVESNTYKPDSATLKIPKYFCSENFLLVTQNLEEASSYKNLILDLSKTKHLDLEGIHFLINTAENREHTYIRGVRRNVRLLLILHKAWPPLRGNCKSLIS